MSEEVSDCGETATGSVGAICDSGAGCWEICAGDGDALAGMAGGAASMGLLAAELRVEDVVALV